MCGIGAALGWAAGFVAAKHGISVGFSPADLAFHRFFWSGLLLMPVVLRDGIADLGGIGWGRGLVMSVLSGPPQAMLAYTGFMLVPLGHGTTIQPACAALFGLILATLVLGERPTGQRIFGGATIIAGLMVFGAESLTTIGSQGVGGDLLFATAGLFWAIVRHPAAPLARVGHARGGGGRRAVGRSSLRRCMGCSSAMPACCAWAWHENLLQAVVQGLLAGMLPIYLFARAVILLGAGRAATFPALVPGFALIIGYLALGVVPSIPQVIGLVIVVIGFRFALR